MFSDIQVIMVDKMGTDDTVCDAARVSFGFNKTEYTPEQNERLINLLANPDANPTVRHWEPFAHCMLSFNCSAPLFVVGQIDKHRVGGVRSQRSMRYYRGEVTFYEFAWRFKPKGGVKQGTGELVDQATQNTCHTIYEETCRAALYNYNDAINNNISPEQARAMLPQSMMTYFKWTGSLYYFFNAYKQRNHKSAQKETRHLLGLIATQCSREFPISWKALVRGLK